VHAHPVDKFNPPATSLRQQSRYHRTINVLTAIVLLGFSILFVSDWLGLRLNTTHSVDPGFYWVVEKLPEKGDYVSFCSAQDSMTQMAYERGYIGFGNCPGHTERLLKIVYGTEDDIIELTQNGVEVNGDLLPFSTTLTQDGLNRQLVPFDKKKLVLQPNELWVMTNRNPLSFDSRYFGPIQFAQVSAVVKPIWTWQ
jgi:conjugative transfer signal peptidase TraF